MTVATFRRCRETTRGKKKKQNEQTKATNERKTQMQKHRPEWQAPRKAAPKIAPGTTADDRQAQQRKAGGQQKPRNEAARPRVRDN